MKWEVNVEAFIAIINGDKKSIQIYNKNEKKPANCKIKEKLTTVCSKNYPEKYSKQYNFKKFQ